MGRAKRIVMVVLAAVVVFHVGGAWYFAGEVEASGLAIDHGPWDPELEVVAISDDDMTLQVIGEPPDGWDTLARIGIESSDGRAWLGRVTVPDDGSQSRPTVTRTIQRLVGPAPEVGDRVNLDIAMFVDPSERGSGFEEITFTSPVGELGAWLVETEGATTWAIVVHGRTATRREGLRVLPALVAAGRSVLIVDYRNDPGVPEDPTGQYRFGETEWEDVAAAIDVAVERGARAVDLVGFSMGGAIVASTLRNDVDAPISRLILDSPVLDFGDTVDLGASDTDLVPGTGLPIPGTLIASAKFVTSLRYGIDFDELRWQHWFEDLDVPVLLVHGTVDATVPFASSMTFVEQSDDRVTLVPLEGVGHVRGWNADPDAYERRVVEWLVDADEEADI